MSISVCGIAGSLRKGSYNRALLGACLELAPEGMTIQVFDRLRDIPPYDGDQDTPTAPEPVAALRSAIAGADALLLVTPEYNFGIPGVLKNAIDWASRPPGKSCLNTKPAAILGASPGLMGTVRAQMALRQSLMFTETYVLMKPEVLVTRASEKFDASGRLHDEQTRGFVRQLLDALVLWTERIKR